MSGAHDTHRWFYQNLNPGPDTRANQTRTKQRETTHEHSRIHVSQTDRGRLSIYVLVIWYPSARQRGISGGISRRKIDSPPSRDPGRLRCTAKLNF